MSQKLLCELDDTGFVPDREQCPLHGLVYAEQERKMYADYFMERKLQHPILELKKPVPSIIWYTGTCKLL
jgi:hypothetical protein